MAYGTGTGEIGRRVTDYGYGLDDIQRARDRLGQQSAINQFQLDRKFKDMGTAQTAQMNQRGMLDSGVRRKAQERMAGDKIFEQFGLQGQRQEAERQLDRQRFMLEEALSGGLQSDAIADALRRFGVAQSLQGLI
tara:strand:- start:96 stop:500 length:405 start_codon:yes stop_codon:yes gene_type:complete